MRIILLLVLLGLAAPGRAETVATCTGFIDTLPAVLTTGGTWCLDHDGATSMKSGTAVTVAANNVTIDCNGFKIGGLGAGPETTALGIGAMDRLNTVVRHCNVRGFRAGMLISGGGGHVIEHNRVEASTLAGIFLVAPGVFRDNQVFGTGGSGAATGIAGYGVVDVIDNTVSGVRNPVSGGSVYGVLLSSNPGSLVERNIIRGLETVDGFAYGLYLVTGSDRVLFRDNDILGRKAELEGAAIFCQAGETNALMFGNSMLNIPFPTNGCVDAGRNVELVP